MTNPMFHIFKDYDIIVTMRRETMLIYKENNDLVTISLGSIYRNLDLMMIRSEATFKGTDSRFYKIVSKDVVARDIKHLTWYSRHKEAVRRFRESTHVYISNKYIDKEHNMGYVLDAYEKFPTIFTYKMLYPAITEFFQFWVNCPIYKEDVKSLSATYDLSKLFVSMENFRDLNLLFLREDGEQLKKSLYQHFPEFAIFYYEIYPYINIEILGKYDITKLVNARLQVYELGLETEQFEQLISNIPVAENNAKVLGLIKNPKVDFTS